MRMIGQWSAGLVVSALAHLGAGAALLAALQPEPVAEQSTPQSRLNVEAQQVARSNAAAKEPAAERRAASEPEGTALGIGAIAQSAAPPQAAPAQSIAPVLPKAVSSTIAPSAPAATRPQAAAPPLAPADTAALPSALLEATVAEGVRLAAAAVPATDSPPRPAAPIAAPNIAAPSENAPPRVPDADAARPVAAPVQTAPPQAAPSLAAALQQPEVTTQKAALAFPSQGQVDPVSLAAFQSFTQPDSASGTQVRDALSAALSVPCSRMQVIFDPETAALQLVGHIPDAAQRAPVLSALRAQMGSDIPVDDNLLILPAPQCAALSGIASLGLPQSTDQITNPLIVGEDTHARAFDFRAGEPLVIDMGGADYPAYVYLDYFDAAGNVIHLSPNAQAPLAFVPPEAPVSFGARTPQEPGLMVQIGPPFGQEIAAAFASSVPLYEGLRPIVEPAGPYLDFMRAQVAQARAMHPGYRGEWVYFFVSTGP